MENSENKSLISTGSSNLAKTEKLLSITKKILSEIKLQYESVKIGNQEWMTRNLDVDRFRNGDLIPHVELYEEWEKVGENGQPAWCYYKNSPENGMKYGKLYNWYAVNDPRGLAPEGWHVPTEDEWTCLVEYLGEDNAGHRLKSIDGWENWKDENKVVQNGNGDNSTGFNTLPGGFRYNYGRFDGVECGAFFLTSSHYDNRAIYRFLYDNSNKVETYNAWLYDVSVYYKSVGASVRCLKDLSDSKWVQAVKNGTIKPYIPPGLKLK